MMNNNNNNNNEPFAALRAALNRDQDTLNRERDRFQRLQQDLAEAGERAERRGHGGRHLGRGCMEDHRALAEVWGEGIINDDEYAHAQGVDRGYYAPGHGILAQRINAARDRPTPRPTWLDRAAPVAVNLYDTFIAMDKRDRIRQEVVWEEADMEPAERAEMFDAAEEDYRLTLQSIRHVACPSNIPRDAWKPAPDSVIEVLPEFIQENLREHFMMTNGTEIYECPVCMGDINIKDSKYKKCGHAFCGTCIERCGPECAVCRQ